MIKTKVIAIVSYTSNRHDGVAKCYDVLVCHYLFGYLISAIQIIGVTEYDVERILGKPVTIDKATVTYL